MVSFFKKSTIVIENQYFICSNLVNSLFTILNIEIEQCENWQKMGFRNRCVIAGPNGLINLTVPLENGRNQKRLIREVRIDNSVRWQKQHWRTIVSCYGKAPFFEYYSNWLDHFYQKRFIYLFDMNLEILNWVIKTMKISVNLSLTKEFIKIYPDNVIDYRNRWVSKNFQHDASFIKYNQVFEDKNGFQKNLSVLDILFCEGPNSILLMKQHKL